MENKPNNLDNETLNQIVHAVMETHRDLYGIEPKEHIRQHQFIGKLEKLVDRLSASKWNIITNIISGVMLVLVLALVVFGLYRCGVDIKKYTP